ncbi:hypothetical protein pb186bvf_009249 [Paramecium bursaria]
MKVFIIALQSIMTYCQLCNLDLQHPADCLLTSGLQCFYSQFQNSCQPSTSTIMGCSINLNKLACTAQLEKNGIPSLCYFDGRCKDAQDYHFKNLGCSDGYSYHACLQQTYYSCAWVDGKCQNHQFENYNCEHQQQVSSQVCSIITEGTCVNGGMSQNYACTSVVDLETVKCNQAGLNPFACKLIKTKSEICIFQNNQCQDLQELDTATCDLIVNQQACLSITNPSQKCEWKNNQCMPIIVDKLCTSYQQVNQNVCSSVLDSCYYDQGNCLVPTTAFNSCTYPGLSKITCFNINLPCMFQNGKCQNAQPLNILRCDQQLNQIACLNLQTAYQYCQWDQPNNQCINIQITQTTQCNLTNVNGNLCKAIISEPCKYDQANQKCAVTEIYDTCTTKYMNLQGCVSISYAGQYCQWSNAQCNTIIITKYQTKCTSLTFSNPNACQLVYNKDPNEQNCYFDSDRQGCNTFLGTSSTLGCTQIGLNQIGCANIRTSGLICRFYRGQCTQITDQSQLQSSNCIEVTSVNPQTCSLIVFNQERCKYNSDTMSCISSVDIYQDNCDTIGLNRFGCAAIVNHTCYFEDQRCQSVTTQNSQVILDNSFCIQSYPSRSLCLSITQTSQLCTWIPQKNQCTNMQIVQWNYCLDYVYVNPNVCASVRVSNPNINNNSGYCIFNQSNFSCAIFQTTCSTPCCDTLLGINAHVCSRFTSVDHYCYFGSDLRCHEMQLEQNTDTYAAQFISVNSIICENLNYKACNLVNWSQQQLCLQISPTDRCQNVDISKLADYSPFYSSLARVNKFTCSGTTLASIYFKYDYTNKRCQTVPITDQYSCTTDDININVCTRLTLGYCKWDLINLKCMDAPTYLSDPTLECSSVLNQNACNDFPNSPCMFNMLTNRCSMLQTPDPTKGCAAYQISNNITVAQLTCGFIIKLGEACLYDSTTNGCVNSVQPSNSCEVIGSNKYYCYSNTIPYCVWNETTHTCLDVPTTPDPTLVYQCSNVNKQLCLAIKNYACAWDTVNFICKDIPYSASASCTSVQNPNFLYNKKACTQITLAGSYCHWSSNQCVVTTALQYQCSTPPMNINSCSTKTANVQCIFTNGNCINFMSSLNIPCNTPGIGVEICTQITRQPCQYNISTMTCQAITISSTTKCSSLIDSNFYNRLACISISPSLSLDASQAYTVCSSAFCGYQKYCYWDADTTKCKLPQLAIADSGVITTYVITYGPLDFLEEFPISTPVYTPYCNIIYNTFTLCSNVYSQAMCLELVQGNCFFDLNSGGCQPILGKESVPLTCENVSFSACSQVSSPGLLCGKQSLAVDGCVNPYRAAYSCNTLSIVYGALPCSTYYGSLDVNSLVCSYLTGSCQWNGIYCDTLQAGSYCDLKGLSIDGCTALGTCTAGPPCQSALTSTIASCDAINSMSYSASYLQYLCITAVINDGNANYSNSCGWYTPSGYCYRLGLNYACSQFTYYMMGPQVCLLYTSQSQQGCVWSQNQCLYISSPVNSCVNLNQFACTTLTIQQYCLWINNQCQQVAFSDIAQYTDCTIANQVACQYIGSNCWIQNSQCQQSQSNSRCSSIQSYSGNIKACIAVTKNGQNCFWNTLQGYCDADPPTNLPCETLGLNNQSCYSNTQGLCFFNGTCQSVTSTNQPCVGSNYNLCISNTQNACYWSQDQCNQIVFRSNMSCKNFYSQGSSTVNPRTCAMIQNANQNCAYDTSSLDCYSITTGSCSVTGINQLACLTVTKQPCQFDTTTYTCSQVSNLNQDCVGGFNNLACISLTKQPCYFDSSCKNFDFSQVNSTNFLNKTTQYVYNFRVCSQIDMSNAFLYYNATNYKCVSYTGAATLKCSQQGINKQACIFKTSQNCMFSNGICSIIYDFYLSTYTCTQFTYSFNTCMNLLSYPCAFVNSQCQSILPSDDCQALTNKIVNQYSCTSQTSKPCSYNPSTNKCVVQTSKTLDCTTTGLNKLGCLSYTTTQRCLFDSLTNSCVEGVLSTYKCSDPLNDKNCAQVSVAGEYCYFDNYCQTLSDDALLICVKAYKHNSLSCPFAQDQPCSYDTANQGCRVSTGLEDCATDSSLNEMACKMNQGPSMCYWNGQNCVVANATIPSTKYCSDSINKLLCVAITTANQFCRFTTECIFQKPVRDSCSSLVNVNRYEYCELPTDQPCMFDLASKSCRVLAVGETIANCQRGLNNISCTNRVSDTCLFTSFCYSPSQIAVCEQAKTQSQCLGLTTQPCKWQGTCSTFDSTSIACATINTFPVVPLVCFQSLVNVPYVCAYDSVNLNCYELQPSSCSEINKQSSCQQFSVQPCLWINNSCKSICSDVGQIGTNRACRDVNKYGQYCKFYQDTLTCDVADTFTSCSDPVNYNSCMVQTVEQCQWFITTQLISSIQYQKGDCTSITDISSIACSNYLSQLACLNVVQKNSFCYFFDQMCQIIKPQPQIDLYQYTMINQNVCSLVTTQAAQYDADLRACKQLVDFTCETKGINRLGCISITTQRCRWDSLNYVCQSEELDSTKKQCFDSDVSPPICQQCQGNACLIQKWNALCGDLGINYAACLKITTQPCQWINNQCQQYITLVTCENIPIDVNALVCSMVQGACKFDGVNKCASVQLNDNCETFGLSQEACVSLKGCIYQNGQCQYSKQIQKCLTIGYASPDMCSTALDSCKYDPISLQCVKPSFETCSTQGLSKLGCDNLQNCYFDNNSCQCTLYAQSFPKCAQIEGQSKCEQLSYCYNDLINYKQGDQTFQISSCRDLECKDMQSCNNSQLNGYPCYLDRQFVCQQATNCSNIDSDNCDIIIQGQICVEDNNKCTELVCENLTTNCPQDYCTLKNNKCITLECSFLSKYACENAQQCYWNDKQCVTQNKCDFQLNYDSCVIAKYQNKQCGWVDQQDICTDTPCRFLAQTYQGCEGLHTESQICVVLQDLSCVACEEITDTCVCLERSQYCYLEYGTNKCFSKQCSSYDINNCPDSCRLVNKKCQSQCNKIYNLNMCLNSYKCQWDYKLKSCGDEVEIDEVTQLTLPEYNVYSLIPAFIIYIL